MTEQRMLITKLVRRPDGKADLFGRGHRYKDLTLFDVTDLADVGLNFEDLPVGIEMPCRFWAVYEESEKLNQAGNPYKDIVALQPVDRLDTPSSPDTDDLLQELREIKALLRILVEDKAPAVLLALKYGDGDLLDQDNRHEVAAFNTYRDRTGHVPASRQDLRDWWREHGQNGNGSARPRQKGK